MIHSELLQFTTLYKSVKYDDTIYVVILDIDSFPNLCGIPIHTSRCQLNLISLYFIDIHDIFQCYHIIQTHMTIHSQIGNTPGM